MTKHILVSPTFAPLLSAKYNVRRIWEMGYVRRAKKKKTRNWKKLLRKKGEEKKVCRSLSSHLTGGGGDRKEFFPLPTLLSPHPMGKKLKKF